MHGIYRLCREEIQQIGSDLIVFILVWIDVPQDIPGFLCESGMWHQVLPTAFFMI